MLLLTPDTQDAALDALDAVAATISTRRTLLPFAERQNRLTTYRSDIPGFGKTYAPEYVPEAYADHHFTIFQAMSLRTGRLIVILLPRRSGKSTILFLIVLHAICFSLEKYIVIIEHDHILAQSVIKKFVKMFETNPNIIQDFPDVRPASPWKASGGELNFSNGTMLRSIGLNQLKSRGSTNYESRITFAMGNDLVDLKNARSPTETTFIYDLFTKDIAEAGPLPGEGVLRRCYLGTSIGQSDAAWRLSTAPLSKVIKIPAITGEPEIVKSLMQVISDDARHITDYCDTLEAKKLDRIEKGELDPEETEITNVEQWEYIRANREKYDPFFAIPEPGQEDHFVDPSEKPLKSYWPQVYSMAYFVFTAAKDTAAFMQEYQHVTGDVYFQKYFRKWFVPYETLPSGHLGYGITIDQAGEPKDGTDPVVVFSAAFDYDDEDIYPVQIWCDQGTPEEIVYTTYAYAHQLASLGAGPVQEIPVFLEGQVGECSASALFEQIRQKEIAFGHTPTYPDGSPRPEAYRDPTYWATLLVIPVLQRKNKMERLLSFRAIAEQRRLHYRPGDPGHELMVTQFCHFQGEPTHKHLPLEWKIDIPDMVELFYQQIKIYSAEPVWMN